MCIICAAYCHALHVISTFLHWLHVTTVEDGMSATRYECGLKCLANPRPHHHLDNKMLNLAADCITNGDSSLNPFLSPMCLHLNQKSFFELRVFVLGKRWHLSWQLEMKILPLSSRPNFINVLKLFMAKVV